MIWTSLLLNASCFGVYLLLFYLKFGVHPSFGATVAALLLLGLLPSVVGFYTNRNALTRNPTVAGLVGVNLLWLVLYCGLFLLGTATAIKYFLSAPIGLLDWRATLLPLICLFASWLGGAYFGLQSAKLLATDGYNIAVVEIGLVVMVPSILLLAFQSFPFSVLLLLIVYWFVTLAFSLSLEGRGRTPESAPRYEIVIFHISVSILIAAAVFVLAFYGQVEQLLEAARRGFIALVYFVFGLLDLLFSEPTAIEPPPFDVPTFNAGAESGETIRDMPLWLYTPLFILAAIFLVVLLKELVKLLKTRLSPGQVSLGRRRSFLAVFLQTCRWLSLLVLNVFKKIYGLLGLIGALAVKVSQKFKDAIRWWFAPKTPDQKVFRIYEHFLNRGKRSGHPRDPWETPLEYAERLRECNREGVFPNKEIGQLTDIFVKAHYGREPVNDQQVQQSEALFNKIRQSL